MPVQTLPDEGVVDGAGQPGRRLGSPDGNPLATGSSAEISGFDDPDFTYGYYADQMNDSSSMSFNTAFFVSALERGRKVGFALDERMIRDATRLVETAKYPDGAFAYYGNHKPQPRMALENLAANEEAGVGDRTLHVGLALDVLRAANRVQPALVGVVINIHMVGIG